MRFARFAMLLGVVTSLVLFVASCPKPKIVVTVKPPNPNVELGGTIVLTAASTDSDDKAFSWTSDSVSCALVLDDGQVKALRLGTAVVLAKGNHSGAVGSTKITVVPPAGFNEALTAGEMQTPVVETESSLEWCRTEVTIPGIHADIHQEGTRLFHELRLGGAAETADPGKPRLPFLTYEFVIPRDAKTLEAVQWQVAVTKNEVQTLTGVVPYPAQPPAWLDDLPAFVQGQKQDMETTPPDRPAFTIQEETYSSAKPYPGKNYETETYTMGDLNIVRVYLYPVQYWGAARVLEVAHKMELTLDFGLGVEVVTAPIVTGDYTGTTPLDAVNECHLPTFLENANSIIRIGPSEMLGELPLPDHESIQDEYFQLLILTRPALIDQAWRLAEHRQAEGWRVYLGSVSSGDWEYVREIVEMLWDDNEMAVVGGTLHPFRDLLIFGDTEHIETCPGMNYRGLHRPTDPAESVSIVGTDNRYATLEGSDHIPEFAVGRISVDDLAEAEAVVSKIIRYESQEAPPNNMATYAYFQEEPTPWLELAGQVTFTVGSSVVTGTGTEFETHFWPSIYADYIRIQGGYDDYDKWSQISYVVSERRLDLASPFDGPSNVTGTAELGYLDGRDDWEFVKGAERVRQWMLNRGCLVHFGYTRSFGPVPHRAFDGSVLPDDLLFHFWDTTTADVQARWRQGHDGIVLHCDHGTRSGWIHPHFRTADVVSRSSVLTGYDPIVLNMNCKSGWFDNECDMRAWGDDTDRSDADTGQNSECFSEALLRQPNGGAVAVIAAIRSGDAGRNDKLIDGVFGAFYSDYEEGTMAGRTSHIRATRLGAAFLSAKMHQRPYMSNETYMQYNMEIYHLFGDPMMRLNLPQPVR